MNNDLNWFKSTYSSPQGGDCVEVASCTESVHIRDSKDLAVPSLSVSPSAWAAFLDTV
ncbi:DUF397 domain-containing protein [Streptomyces sp. NPDC056501]|uniref:DUF397 domain-containing protein n=1 Tax=Streptomyces sp. NPDC056501 TaxID=3345841 RepID=UPI00367D7BCA